MTQRLFSTNVTKTDSRSVVSATSPVILSVNAYKRKNCWVYYYFFLGYTKKYNLPGYLKKIVLHIICNPFIYNSNEIVKLIAVVERGNTTELVFPIPPLDHTKSVLNNVLFSNHNSSCITIVIIIVITIVNTGSE